MRLTEKDVEEILQRRKAVLTGLHVVYTSGKHGDAYVNKDAVLPYVTDTSRLCEEIAHRTKHLRPEVVVGPVAGAVALSHWLAYHLSIPTGQEVLAVYADRVTEEPTLRADRDRFMNVDSPSELGRLKDEIRARPPHKDSFVLKRGYDKLVEGKRTFVIEDVINTGMSLRGSVAAVRAAGGLVIGGGALVNRGKETANSLDIPELITLLNVEMSAWEEHEMPDWLRNRPITTEVGKGREYLAKKGSSST